MKAFMRLPHGFGQALRSFLTTTLISKLFYVLLATGYLLSFWEPAEHALAITPRYLLPPHFWIWTLVTHVFMESSTLLLCADFVCIHMSSKLIQPLWGTKEIVKFYSIVVLGSTLATTLALFATYYLLSDEDLMFSTSIRGFVPICGAILVAVKQTLTDDVIFTTRLGRMKNGHIPLLVCCLLGILSVLGVVNVMSLAMFVCGAFVGWLYLRFYQKHSNGSIGDGAEHFAFATFFPSVIQPFIAAICSAVFGVLLKVGLCRRPLQRVREAGSRSGTARSAYRLLPTAASGLSPSGHSGAGSAGHGGKNPAGSGPDAAALAAHRHMLKAKRELEERLQRTKNTMQQDAGADWPSLDDDVTTTHGTGGSALVDIDHMSGEALSGSQTATSKSASSAPSSGVRMQTVLPPPLGSGLSHHQQPAKEDDGHESSPETSILIDTSSSMHQTKV